MPTAETTFYADLHVHSKYSRATSKQCDLEHLAYWAQKKGIAVVGTGDFTHPAWRAELRDKLVPAEPGLFRLRDDIERAVHERLSMPSGAATRFQLSVEISTIYKKTDATGARTRKVHHLIYAPDFETVDRMVARLAKIGNLGSDGRPILGLDSRDLLEIVLDAGEHAYLVPAHVWTPWFSVLGSRSGFDEVAACYGDLAEHIFAIETGLSSDPPMNWRLSRLDRYTLVSNSDAHSPAKLGREACKFATDMDYFAMRRALETGRGYGGTVEFFPEEGKYHLDGHRKCGVVLEPEQTRTAHGLCPVCGKPLTVGVMHRVQELADRPDGFRPEGAHDFRSLVPLPEVIAEILGTGAGSKAVGRTYEGLLAQLGSELFILDHAPVEDLRRGGQPRVVGQLAEGIARMRAGQVIRQPGYDGEYGVIRLFDDRELRRGKAVSLALALAEPAARKPPGPDASGSASSDPEPSPSQPPETSAAQASPEPRDNPPRGASPGAPDANAGEPGPRPGGVLAALDPDQRRAAGCIEGPLLIIAGPGTGKTRTLTHRIAHLIADLGVPPDACLAITFTNRAAGEMRERLEALLPGAGPRVPVQTFHGLALRILREHRQRAGLHRGFRVATDAERVALLSEALGCTPRKARSVLARIERARVLRRAETGAPQVDPELADMAGAYRAALDQASLLDFDDLLVRAVALLEEEDIRAAYRERFPHVSIDEYQDIDELQYRLVSLLCAPWQASEPGASHPAPWAGRSLCAIGDPDQAIYGFRGADVGLFLRFREEFADTRAGTRAGAREVHLTRNYRSTPAIVDAALQAIAPSSLVADRVLRAVAADAASDSGAIDAERIDIVETASERAEAELVVHTIETLIGGTSFFSMDSDRVGHAGETSLSFSDFAVLYRTGAQAAPLCEALARSGIPFQKRSHIRLADEPLVIALVERMRALLDVPEATAALDDLTTAEAPAGALARALRVAATSLPAHLGAAQRGESPGPGHDSAQDSARSGNGDSQVTDALGLDATQLDAIVDMLLPVAARCDDDLDRFLGELAMDTEIDLWDPRADRVSLLTLHAAKGLEFPVVFLAGCEDGILPMRWGAGGGAGNEDEERRLFFVGMTRARQRLYLLHARKRRWRGKPCELPLSPFVRAIEEQLMSRRRPRTRPKAPAGHEQLGLF